MSKKFINKPENVVEEMLEGIVWASGGLISHLGVHNVLVRSDIDEVKHQQVSLLCGGGSGFQHESSFCN